MNFDFEISRADCISKENYFSHFNIKQEVSLKKIIVEGYRTVGSLNDSFQSSNFLLVPFVFVVLY